MKAKRTLTSAVAVLTAASLLVGCGASTASESVSAGDAVSTATGESTTATGEFEPMTIAVGTNSVDETFTMMKEACDNVIGPALNIKFI